MTTRAPWPRSDSRAALADVAEAADHRDLAADHHVGGAVDAVDQRVAAAVEVVELRLRHRVVDVDRREQQLAALDHLVEPVHAGGRLLGDAFDALRRCCVQRCGSSASERVSSARITPNSSESALGGIGHRAGALVLGALVHEQRRVAAVVEDHVRRRRAARPASAAPARCTTSTPRASRPSRRTPARRAGPPAYPSGPTATAAAAWSWVEKMLQLHQRTSAPSAVSVSISTAVWIVMCSEPVMRAPRSGCVGGVLAANRHQTGHLVLGERDLLAAELGEREVGDLEVGAGDCGGGVHCASCSVR